ncbi:response regulator [Streptomyces barkulensis]|uniref:response regulator n=1 Tax=Streptomyces barkulensis TaxID=1257026 RepID=UPI001F117E04|nr:response regulator transcription factor [Streptomyces barkulensis]
MNAPEPGVTRILLADDHALVRRGVRLILDGEPDLSVVAEAGDGAEAVAAAREHPVDLAVLDVAMPRMTGLQAARELSARHPGLRILILSMYDNEQYLFEALKAGASGYVLTARPSATAPPCCTGTPRPSGTPRTPRGRPCRSGPAPPGPPRAYARPHPRRTPPHVPRTPHALRAGRRRLRRTADVPRRPTAAAGTRPRRPAGGTP